MHSVKTAAAKLGISPSKVYQLTGRRQVSFYRIGGKILFEDADLERYKKAARVEAVPVKVSAPPVRRRTIALKHVLLAREGTSAISKGAA